MTFDFYHIVLYFFLYAFVGWCVEVAYHAVTFAKLINRGFLNGPWCPIYGFGMLAVLGCLTPVREQLPLLFIGGTALATGIELVGGWALYRVFRARWWDYTDEPFNLGGFVCLRFSLLWGLGAVLMVRVVHPALAVPLALLPRRVGWWLIAVTAAVFAVDFVFTVISVSGLMRDVRELEALRRLMRAPSDRLTETIGTAAMKADLAADEARLQALLAKSEWLEENEDELADLTQRAAAAANRARDRWESRRAALLAALRRERHFGRGRILAAFPRLRSELTDLLDELRTELHGAKKP